MLNNIKRSKLFKRNYSNVIYDQPNTFTHRFYATSYDKYNIQVRLLIGWYTESENTQRLHKNIRVLHKFNESLIEPHHNVIYEKPYTAKNYHEKKVYHNLIYDRKTIEDSMTVYINNEIRDMIYVMEFDDLHRGDFDLKVKKNIKAFLYLCGITIDLVDTGHMGIIELKKEYLDLIKKNNE